VRFGDKADAPGRRDFFVGAGLTIWAAWQLAVLAGIVIGAGVPASWRLEFAAPLAFIAMTIPLLRDRAMVAAAVVAGLTVIAAHSLPFKLSIPAAALAGIAAGMLTERRSR
jgi:predicted branched-subunit amino acid permease